MIITKPKKGMGLDEALSAARIVLVLRGVWVRDDPARDAAIRALQVSAAEAVVAARPVQTDPDVPVPVEDVAAFEIEQLAIQTQYELDTQALRDASDLEAQTFCDDFDPTAFELKAAYKRFAITAQNYVDVVSKKDKYPEFEQKTWDMQREDVIAYVANPAAATPRLDKIALARGRDRLEHIQATMPKALGFVELSLSAAGARQGMEDKADAAAKINDWQAIQKMELVF